MFFTQPRLHSPTGSVAQLAHLHRVLQLADKHDLLVVENDIYADLDPEPRPSLASLDQLARVVHVSSFSKTISPNLRVGFLAAHPDLVEDLAQLKMTAGLTSSEFTERLAHGVLTDARWRKHLKGPRERLAQAHARVGQRLDALGFRISHEPKAGLFLWARHPQLPDAGRGQRSGRTRHPARAGSSVRRRPAADAVGCASTPHSATTSGCSTSWARRCAVDEPQRARQTCRPLQSG